MTVGAISSCPQHATPPDVVVPARIEGTHAHQILLILARRANRAGETAVLLSELGDELATSRRQVRRSVRTLEEAGLVEIIQRAQAAGRYSPPVYRILSAPQLELPGMRVDR